jgi:hypothetical protein
VTDSFGKDRCFTRHLLKAKIWPFGADSKDVMLRMRGISQTSTESLILAQDERWRRA